MSDYKPRAGVDDDGWIAHSPGPCPVPPETMVEVKWRAGAIASSFPFPREAKELNWHVITHYRIVSPAPTGPVRMVTRPEIVPGVYGRLRVWEPTTDGDNAPVAPITFASRVGGHSMGAPPAMFTAPELRAAAETLSQLADAMEQESKV